jgi:hypothetical protein
MPNQFYDPYEYGLMNLRQEIDRKYDEQQNAELAKRELNGVVNVGSGSETSSINRFNAARRKEYMEALDSAQKQRREDASLALQQRAQGFNESSALGQMGITNKNLNRLEKERGDANTERDRRYTLDEETQGENLRRLEQERRDTQQYRSEDMKLRREHFENTKLQEKFANNIALRQIMINKEFESKRISLDKYRTMTEANLKMIQSQTGALSLSDMVNQAQNIASESPEKQMRALLNLMGLQGTQASALNASGQSQQGIGSSLYSAAAGTGANVASTISSGQRQDESLAENARQFNVNQALLREQLEQQRASTGMGIAGRLGGSLIGAAGHVLGRR